MEETHEGLQYRSCIICPPVMCEREDPPLKGCIKAMCGICRTDVWLSQKAKGWFSKNPEGHVLACPSCSYIVSKDVINRAPDCTIADEGFEIQVKTTEVQTGIMMTWLANLFQPEGSRVPEPDAHEDSRS